MGGEGGGEEGGLAVAAAAASGSLGHGDGGNGNGNGKQQSRDAADPAQQQQQHPLPPPPQCASPLGAGAGAPESAVTALEAFSPGTSPMKEGTGGEEEGGEGEGQGQDGRLGGGERAERTLYEASSEEERIVVDGLVSLLAAEGAEKEVDRLLDPFPPPISVASAAAAAEAALAVPPPLSSVHTPRGLVLGLEEPPQLEQPGDGPPALLVPPSSPRAGPVHVSQTGVRVLRRRFHDLKALADRCVDE